MTATKTDRAGAGIFSRRGFLIGGGALGVVAVAGGALALRMTRPEEAYQKISGLGPDPSILDWKELAVLTMLVDACISPTAGMPSTFDTMTARRIDRELSFGSAKLQSDMKASLGYIEILPALGGYVSPFTSLESQSQISVLRKMANAGGTDRVIYLAMKFFSGLFYYSDERAWDSVGYIGPGMPEKPFPASSHIRNLNDKVAGAAT